MIRTPGKRRTKTRKNVKRAQLVASVASTSANRYQRVPRAYVNQGVGFPAKQAATLKYVENLVLVSTGGVTSNYLFRLNSLYDPDYSSTGHQPIYFNQYMNVYNHYCVTGCKMTVTYQPYASNGAPCTLVLWQNDDTTITPTVPYQQAEQSKAQVALSNGQAAPSKATLNWSARKVFGPNPLDNSNLRGTATTNPAEESFGCISVRAADNVSTVNCAVMVELEYFAIFTELRDFKNT